MLSVSEGRPALLCPAPDHWWERIRAKWPLVETRSPSSTWTSPPWSPPQHWRRHRLGRWSKQAGRSAANANLKNVNIWSTATSTMNEGFKFCLITYSQFNKSGQNQSICLPVKAIGQITLVCHFKHQRARVRNLQKHCGASNSNIYLLHWRPTHCIIFSATTDIYPRITSHELTRSLIQTTHLVWLATGRLYQLASRNLRLTEVADLFV